MSGKSVEILAEYLQIADKKSSEEPSENHQIICRLKPCTAMLKSYGMFKFHGPQGTNVRIIIESSQREN